MHGWDQTAQTVGYVSFTTDRSFVLLNLKNEENTLSEKTIAVEEECTTKTEYLEHL